MWLRLSSGLCEDYIKQILIKLPETFREDVLDEYHNMIISTPLEMYEAFSTLTNDHDLHIDSLSELLVLEIHARLHAYYPYSHVSFYKKDKCLEVLTNSYECMKRKITIESVEEEQALYNSLVSREELLAMMPFCQEDNILLQHVANFFVQILYNPYYDNKISQDITRSVLSPVQLTFYDYFRDLLRKDYVSDDDIIQLYKSIDVSYLISEKNMSQCMNKLLMKYECELMMIPFYNEDKKRERLIQSHLSMICKIPTIVAYVHCCQYLCKRPMTILYKKK